MQTQIARFKQILAEHDHNLDQFELNVAGDAFRTVMSGGDAELEVACRLTGVRKIYLADHTRNWLAEFSADLDRNVFQLRR